MSQSSTSGVGGKGGLLFRGDSEAEAARTLCDQWFKVGGTRDSSLWWHNGQWLNWDEAQRRWITCTTDEVVDAVYLILEMSEILVTNRDGSTMKVAYKPTISKVEGIVRAMRAIVGRNKGKSLPRWEGKGKEELERDWDLRYCCAFEDSIVSVEGGVVKSMERDHRWLGVHVIRGAMWSGGGGTEGEECPVWMRCLEQWSCGDEAWKELNRRWMGYLMGGHRNHERWMTLIGSIRGGKSTELRVAGWLVGGAVCGGSMKQLSNPFYRLPLVTARLLRLGEANKQSKGDASEISSLIKSCIGRDEISVAEMYGVKGSVVTEAAVMMASNPIPDLPDEGRGLTGKMLVLPFTVSFVGREDPFLEDKLKGEVSGIAKWALEGLRRLEAAEPSERWPVPQKALEVGNRFAMLGNVLEAFLEARFVRNATGFVSGEILKREWKDYVRKNKIGVKEGSIPDNQLVVRLEMETSWGLERGQVWKGQDRGVRGLKGLSWKKEGNDEV